MFWKKKKKLPITEVDKAWVEQNIKWLSQLIGEERFNKIITVTPTKNFYNRNFDGTKKDAEYVLERTMQLMNIDDVDVKLNFFNDSPVEMSDGTILTSPADINGRWESASGTYQKIENTTIISIELSQLKNPISLIATTSHELAHQILLGENNIEENDEYLTDLLSIIYGFGIFIGNSRFSFSSFSINGYFGWESSTQGYLPEQIIAYTMAFLSSKRSENTDYEIFLNKSMKQFFAQSLKWLKENEK